MTSAASAGWIQNFWALAPLLAFLGPLFAPGWKSLGVITAIWVGAGIWLWSSLWIEAEHSEDYGAGLAIFMFSALSWVALCGLATRAGQLAFGRRFPFRNGGQWWTIGGILAALMWWPILYVV